MSQIGAKFSESCSSEPLELNQELDPCSNNNDLLTLRMSAHVKTTQLGK